MKSNTSVTISEVGPRDGLQNEKALLLASQKIELIECAVAAGAMIVEIGSFVHPKAVPQMADTDEVARGIRRSSGVEYRALVMNLKGLERALAAGINKAKLTVSASAAHSQSNLNKTPEEAVRGFAECADFAAKNGMTLSGAISTAFGYPVEGRTPVEALLPVIRCFLEIGVTELSLSDTTGMANPGQVYDYCRRVQEIFPQVTWNLHFHNTRGMGLANAYAGWLAGVTRFDACFAGIGGCPFAPGASGNIATEDVVHMFEEMSVNTGYDLDALIRLGQKVEGMIGHPGSGSILRAGKNSSITLPCK